MKILVNDGLHNTGKMLLEDAGIVVIDESIPQDQLEHKLHDFDGIIIRSATKVRKELIDKCPNLKFIARGGVGLDNVDVEYAERKGIQVYNTPGASSRSVAELVFGHVLSISRGINQSNRVMPSKGADEFKKLKKEYSKGIELEGKTLGIIGMGRIGTESARIGLGLGMKVIGFDLKIDERQIELNINGQQVNTMIQSVDLNELLTTSDVITVHVPNQKEAIIGNDEISLMKDGVIMANASRGGIIDEQAILKGIDSGKIRGVGLDVFSTLR